jgi:hypothetical protein
MTEMAVEFRPGVSRLNVTHTFLAGRTVASDLGSTTIADFLWAHSA